MRTIKQICSILLFAMLMMGIACSCSGDIDIRKDYEFQVDHLPVPKILKIGESAEIRCELLREGNYEGTKYYIRYFQPDGKGELKIDDGRVLTPNDLYELDRDVFRLYYTSYTDDQQKIDVYFLDNFGKKFTLSFSFSSEKEEKED